MIGRTKEACLSVAQKALIICLVWCVVLSGGGWTAITAAAENVAAAETGHLNYSDGSAYDGELQYGRVRNGVGTFQWSTGEVYEGSWENDTQSGTGKMVWPGLGVYEGEFFNGKREGAGTFTWTYSGTPEEGQPLTYSGQWKDDKIGDQGMMELSGIGVYEGGFSKGLRHGTGTFTWNNGDQYVGGWQNDKMSGDGILTLADGTILEGQFANNIISKGSATYAVDGGKATRTIQGGKSQPNVTITYDNGTVVSGRLNGDEFTGNVTVNYLSGDTYVGTMSNGLKSGKGTYTWSNGAHYVGDWVNDQMSGTGKYYYGKSETDTFLSGTFKNGKPDGTLVYTSEKKLRYNTVWSNGVCTSITYKK